MIDNFNIVFWIFAIFCWNKSIINLFFSSNWMVSVSRSRVWFHHKLDHVTVWNPLVLVAAILWRHTVAWQPTNFKMASIFGIFFFWISFFLLNVDLSHYSLLILKDFEDLRTIFERFWTILNDFWGFLMNKLEWFICIGWYPTILFWYLRILKDSWGFFLLLRILFK